MNKDDLKSLAGAVQARHQAKRTAQSRDEPNSDSEAPPSPPVRTFPQPPDVSLQQWARQFWGREKYTFRDAAIGAVVGTFVSYFFQSGLFRLFCPIGRYVFEMWTRLPDALIHWDELTEEGRTLIMTFVLTVVGGVMAGVYGGKWLARNYPRLYGAGRNKS